MGKTTQITIATLPETKSSPPKIGRGPQKEAGSSSNHPSGAMSVWMRVTPIWTHQHLSTGPTGAGSRHIVHHSHEFMKLLPTITTSVTQENQTKISGKIRTTLQELIINFKKKQLWYKGNVYILCIWCVCDLSISKHLISPRFMALFHATSSF